MITCTHLNACRRWLTGCLLFFGACRSPVGKAPQADPFFTRAYDSIQQALPLLRNGDLVTRTGNDFTSESLRRLNRRDQTYSHCGIVSIENDTPFVYHALGGEFNPDQALLREPFTVFAAPQINRGFGIFRFSLHDTLLPRIISTVRLLYRAAIPFDMDFDLATNDRLYCAEFVMKAYRAGTQGWLRFDSSRLGNRLFAGVDDCFLQPRCREIKRIRFL